MCTQIHRSVLIIALTIFIFGFLASSALLAQQVLPCATPDLTEAEMSVYLSEIRTASLARNAGTTCIPIKPHIVRTDAGTGGLSLTSLNRGLANLNHHFEPAGIEFYYCGESPNYIDNTEFYDYHANEETALASGNEVTNALNVFFVSGIQIDESSFAAGYAYFPFDNARSTRILMDKDVVSTYHNGTYVHELGHTFALPHTHQGTENGPSNSNAERVVRTGNDANCNAAGDAICDTDADPRYSSSQFDSGLCQDVSGRQDDLGVTYTPPVDNVMSYYPDRCGGQLTSGQMAVCSQGLTTRLGHSVYDLGAGKCAPEAVAVPINLMVSINGFSASINWTDNSSNEMGFLIERSFTSATSGFKAIKMGGVAPGVEVFTDDDLSPGTTAYYRVKPSNGDCNSYSNVDSVTVPPLPTTNCKPQYSSTPAAQISLATAVFDTITIQVNDTLIDLDVAIDLSHSYSGDLELRLTHVESGITVKLKNSDNSCSRDDMMAQFDDEAANPADGECSSVFPAALYGYFSPVDDLDTFDLSPFTGSWVLQINDLFNQDNGTLNSWCLVPTFKPTPCDTARLTVAVSICDGSTYFAGGAFQTQAGSYIDIVRDGAANGCDSIITTDLGIVPNDTTIVDTTICNGDSIFAGGSFQNAEGSWIDTLGANIHGCLELKFTSLTIEQVSITSVSDTICAGDSLFVGGAHQTMPGTYFDTLSSALGCDSIIRSSIAVLIPSIDTSSLTACDGDTVLVGDSSYTSSTVHVEYLPGAATNGCDSTSVTLVSVLVGVVKPDTLEEKVSDIFGGFGGTLNKQDRFGTEVQPLGDLDGDGNIEIAVGAPESDPKILIGSNVRPQKAAGAVWILSLNAEGMVIDEQRISIDSPGGFPASAVKKDYKMGQSVTPIGDLDGDNIIDIAIGAPGMTAQDANGRRLSRAGGFYVCLMNADKTIKSFQTITRGSGGLAANAPLDKGYKLGTSMVATGDIDGDNIPDLAVGAPEDNDKPNSNRSKAGAIWFIYLNSDGTAKGYKRISSSSIPGTVPKNERFAYDLASVGDFDGNGSVDIAAGAPGHDPQDSFGRPVRDAGGVYLLTFDGNQDVLTSTILTVDDQNLSFPDKMNLGWAVAADGDLDGDEVVDIVAGAPGSDAFAKDAGRAYVLHLTKQATVKSVSIISNDGLGKSDKFGSSAGVINQGCYGLVMLGARNDDDDDAGKAKDKGAYYLSFADGTAAAKWSDNTTLVAQLEQNNSLSDVNSQDRALTGEPQLLVYPNPNDGSFFIEIPQFKSPDAKIHLYDALGVLVWSKTIQTSESELLQLQINQKRSAGLYHLVVLGEGLKMSRTVIVR